MEYNEENLIPLRYKYQHTCNSKKKKIKEDTLAFQLHWETRYYEMNKKISIRITYFSISLILWLCPIELHGKETPPNTMGVSSSISSQNASNNICTYPHTTHTRTHPHALIPTLTQRVRQTTETKAKTDQPTTNVSQHYFWFLYNTIIKHLWVLEKIVYLQIWMGLNIDDGLFKKTTKKTIKRGICFKAHF